MSLHRPPVPEGICFDAFDTLIALVDPVGRLVQTLAGHGIAVSEQLAADAFAAEVDYYIAHQIEARNEPSLQHLLRGCSEALAEVIRRSVLVPLDGPQLDAVLLDSLHFIPTPGCLACLTELRRRKMPMAVVSNWDCRLEGILTQLGLRTFFRAVVASAIVGCAKPDPAIWQPALRALGTAPEATWHVGDSPGADVDGAREAGLTAILLGDDEAPGDVVRIRHLGELPGLLDAAGGG